MNLQSNLLPLLKWAGGKRQLLPHLIQGLPKSFERYCEPFVGGGALLFALAPQKALINDVNEELVSFYKVVKDHPEDLISCLKEFKNEEEFFYKVRNIDLDVKAFSKLSEIYKAARTYYLNRTCFNGLYRVNRKGHFNSPYGHRKEVFIPAVERILAISEYLNKADITICSGSYLNLANVFKEGDFVYLDPPYDVERTSGFTNYSKNGFSREDQKSLKLLCDSLTEKNINFMLSNSSTDFILDLYRDYSIQKVNAVRLINSKVSCRGAVKEVIVTNY